MGDLSKSDGYRDLEASAYQTSLPMRSTKEISSQRTPTLAWSSWLRATPRVVALDLTPEGSFGPAREYSDPVALQAHLDQQQKNVATPQRSVYVLEALGGSLIAVLQAHFKLHSTVFEDHNRLVQFDRRATGEGGGIPFLPSTILTRDHITYKYHEVMRLSTPPNGFRNLCDVSGRHIAATRFVGEFSDVVVARRKCTVWSRRTGNCGWDCLIICDPPVTRIITQYSGQIGYNVTTTPYNTGYRDFVPQSDKMRNGLGPSRISLLNDIVFYLKTHCGALNLAEPESPRMFVEKIIASHYLKLSEFSQAVIEKVQFNLSRQQDLTSFAVAAVEEQWSDVQSLERRIGEYKDDIEAIMMQTRIPFDSPNIKIATDWRDSAIDYQFLNRRFAQIGQRASGLNGSTAALAGLTNNRQAVKAQALALEATERSIREAKSAKVLTTLGVIFVPLAYVSSLYSMTDSYRPGEEHFWIYWTVALPLILATGLVFYVLHFGFSKWRSQ